MSLITRHTTARLLAGAVLAAAAAASAAPRPVTTPLADANLFISPCGKPYRSKPGEPYPVVAWFNAVDTNHDGKIDKAEFEAEARDFFSTLDRNGDGVITDQEISYYEHSMVPEITAGITPSSLGDGQAHLIQVQMGGGGHGGGGGESSGSPTKTPERDLPRQGAATYGLLNDAEPVRSADRQLDGRITLDEFIKRADHNFDRLDYDQRGYLTLDDLPRTPAQKIAEPMKRTKA
jgi:Ca2+-binding EF-hand superfamily protein